MQVNWHQLYTHAHMHTHTYTHTQTHKHTHTHTHAHKHTNTHSILLSGTGHTDGCSRRLPHQTEQAAQSQHRPASREW